MAQVFSLRQHVAPGALAGALLAAARTVQKGGIVVAPTDTCYGLMASATNPRAVRTLYELKGRPLHKPIAVLVARRRDIWQWGRETPLATSLARRFLPGPVTLVLRARFLLVRDLLGPDDSLGVRVPNHAVARLICCLTRSGLAATSANPAGFSPALTAEGPAATWNSVADLVILDAGPVVTGGVSTVVDARADTPVVMREGMVSAQALSACENVEDRE